MQTDSTVKRSRAYAARRAAAGDKRISIWLKVETLEILDRFAANRDMTREELINTLLDEHAGVKRD